LHDDACSININTQNPHINTRTLHNIESTTLTRYYKRHKLSTLKHSTHICFFKLAPPQGAGPTIKYFALNYR